MSTPWSLSETTFTPAEAEAVLGVPTGLQRQWRMRRLLVAGSRGRTPITLSGMIELSVLKQCSETKIGLETIKHALPALCAEAVFHLALMTERWAFVGGDDALAEYKSWAASQELLGAQYIYRMLNVSPDSGRRYMLIRPTEVRLLNDVSDLLDEFPEQPAILLDIWGIARGLTKRTSRALFWIRKARDRN